MAKKVKFNVDIYCVLENVSYSIGINLRLRQVFRYFLQTGYFFCTRRKCLYVCSVLNMNFSDVLFNDVLV